MTPIDPAKVAAYRIPTFEGAYTARDAVLYALGIGLGHDPLDEGQLAFVYEERGPKVLPTFASVIGDRSRWLADPELGLGDAPNVHGDQTIAVHAPIPAEGRIGSESRVVGLWDRGPGSHAILVLEEKLADAASGAPLATLRQTDVLIGAGGFGGDPPPPSARPAMPERAPDATVEHPVAPQAALLYRLCGDHYALHVEPELARRAGFDGPILHGLATWGIACHAVAAACCAGEPARIARFHGRFTAPVYPGETLATELWREGRTVFFRTTAAGRGAVVLDHGRADLGS